MKSFFALGLLLPMLPWISGCGGSSTVPVVIYITISPLNTTVSLGSMVQFTETTSGSANTDVTWQVNGIDGGNSTYGTISSSGLYTPPVIVPNPPAVTVTVISQANTAYIANANVAILSGIAVAVSPTTANLQLGQTQQFTATVTGNSNTTVTWFAGGIAGGNATYGTITPSGLYTAPASGGTPLAVTVSAVSQVDVSKLGTANVIVHGGIALSLAPNPAVVETFRTLQFHPTISGTTNTGLTWQVNGINGGSSAAGTISAAGLYTAPHSVPTVAQGGTSRTAPVTATAISQADATVSASVVVTILAPNQAAQDLPIPLGVSGGNASDAGISPQPGCCSGTLGALVSRGGAFYILGNNHVLARTDGANPGEGIIQPGLLDTNCAPGDATTVATLTQFASLESPGTSLLAVDAAIAQIVAGKVDVRGTIRELGDSTSDGVPLDAPPHAGPGVTPAIGKAVAKSGRSTGLTCSLISATNLTANVVYPRSCGSSETFTVRFSNLVVISGGSFSAEGDSGSLVVAQDTADPVALLVGSSDSDSIAQPVSDVLAALADPSTGERATFVGTANPHPVAACSLTAFGGNASSSSAALSLPAQVLAVVSNIRDLRASALASEYGLEGVGVGPSLDAPGEVALLLFVGNREAQGLPSTVDGIRTRIVRASLASNSFVVSSAESMALLKSAVSMQGLTVPSAVSFTQAVSAHQENVEALLGLEGVEGVGIGASADDPGEAALVIFVLQGAPHGPIPAEVGGVRTQVREVSSFRVGSRRANRASCKAVSGDRRVNAAGSVLKESRH